MDQGEDALTTQLVSGAKAVQIDVVPVAAQGMKASKVIFATPSTLKKVLTSVKKRPAHSSIPRCMPSHRVELHFLDATGKEISKVDTSCAGFGTLSVGEQTTPIKTTLDYVALSAQPLVPGDALWGISEVEVTQHTTQKNEKVTADEEVAKLVAAIDADQKIDPHAPLTRCRPDYSVVFRRANKDVASTSFICGSPSPPAKITARFTIEGLIEDETMANGGVSLDPRPFVKLF